MLPTEVNLSDHLQHNGSDKDFQDAVDEKVPDDRHAAPEPPPKRSMRISKKPGKWWKVGAQVSQASSVTFVLKSLHEAIFNGNVDFR